MHSDTLALQKIFGQDRRLIVPLFQRPYVWKQEDQWEPLWEDIVGVAERALCKVKAKPHFMGAIVLDSIRTQTGHLDTRLVIDGQQRLTTLQLLLEAFCDYCETVGEIRFHKALLKLTRNDDPMSEDPDEVFKIWPTTVDQQHFRQVLEVKTPSELKQTYNKAESTQRTGHTLADAYLFFHEAVEEWLNHGGDEERPTRIEALYTALRDRLMIVVIDLDEQDDAQVIFETLNARGTPLLPADLVKNFLFHRIRHEGGDVDGLYAKFWRKFDEDDEYWRKDLGRGHTKRARIDWFLQNFLTAITRKEVATSHLYTAFRDFASGTQSPQQHLESLNTYGNIYRSFDETSETEPEGVFFSRLRSMSIMSVHPFVLELVVQRGGFDADVLTILRDIESFLVRRMVCGLNTRGYNRFFVELCKAFEGESGELVNRVRATLLNSDADSNRWPDDEEFLKEWLNRPIYKWLAQSRTRMILEAIERQQWGPKTEKIQLGEKLQIEHLMPQSWEEFWALPPNADPIEAAEERTKRENAIQTIGNLTLLTSSLNPSVSNGAWAGKREEIVKHSALSLNRPFTSVDIWDEAAIATRAKELFTTAIKIWPFPANHSQSIDL